MKFKKNTLVTGSRGFIGRAVMLNMAGSVKPYDVIDAPQQNIESAEQLWRASYTCDSAVHLAAIPGVAQCAKHPWKAQRVNAEGTFRVLYNAKKEKMRGVIFASSAAADRRDSIYGWTKYIAEQWCQMAREEWDLNVTVLRLANVYGPGSIQKGSVVAKWMRQILYTNATYISVYGGNQLRDFVFVEDVANIIAWRLRQMEPWDDEPWHYVGTRKMTTLNELASLVIKTGEALGVANNVVTVIKDAPDESNVSAEGVADRRFDCTTELEDGLVATWEYFIRQHEKGIAVDAKELAT